jgi:hypothetical protein
VLRVARNVASPLAGQIQGSDLFIDGGATKTIL